MSQKHLHANGNLKECAVLLSAPRRTRPRNFCRLQKMILKIPTVLHRVFPTASRKNGLCSFLYQQNDIFAAIKRMGIVRASNLFCRNDYLMTISWRRRICTWIGIPTIVPRVYRTMPGSRWQISAAGCTKWARVSIMTLSLIEPSKNNWAKRTRQKTITPNLSTEPFNFPL